MKIKDFSIFEKCSPEYRSVITQAQLPEEKAVRCTTSQCHYNSNWFLYVRLELSLQYSPPGGDHSHSLTPI